MPKKEDRPEKLSRRDYLKLSGAAIAAGFVSLLVQLDNLFVAGVPLPGAVPVSDFLQKCIRCGRCAAVCDQQAVQMDVDGYPAINGISGWCDFCMLCVPACPTQALKSVDPGSTRLGTAVIDRERCIAWQWTGCRLCSEKCELLQKAVFLDDQLRPYIDEEKCNGCGACVTICPQPASAGLKKKHGKAVALVYTSLAE